ncbi:MAG: flagellar protein FlaG [Desulfurivibrio sp.]|nr:flagellar protein FlaG [Desulfurivibrio sp.]
MDVNLHSDVKGYVQPPATAVEQEEKNRPPVTPVAESYATEGGKADDQSRAGYRQREGGAKPVSLEEARELSQEMQARLDSIGNTRLNFSLHEEPEAVVVQITDRESGEVIKQFPAEQTLELRQKLNELVGMLYDSRV